MVIGRLFVIVTVYLVTKNKERRDKMKKRNGSMIKSNKVKLLILCLVVIAIGVIFIIGQTLGGHVEFTVNFDTDGGSSIESVIVKENEKVTKPSDPIKEGYSFVGWYYNNELYDFDAPVLKNMTLKAKWGSVGKVAGVSLNKSTLELYVGDTYQLSATVLPNTAIDKSLKWESSASSILSVDTNGKVSALKEGSATITVTTKDGGYTDKVTVTVKTKPVVKVTGVSLDKTSLNLTEGDTSKLVATVNPGNATNKNVTWSSSNASVVTVDANGNVRALKAGNATITVTTKDGSYTAKVTVTVKAKPVVKVTGVSLDKTSLNLTEGDTSKLVATVNPGNATNKGLTWSSSNSSVITVDANGNVRALKAGSATITVTTKDGGYTATCTVTVNEKPASYSVIFTPVVQEGIGSIFQYSMVVTKNSATLNDFAFVVYNGTKVSKEHDLQKDKYDKNVTVAQIRLSNGADVTANVVYR